jgi:hypothetical protein
MDDEVFDSEADVPRPRGPRQLPTTKASARRCRTSGGAAEMAEGGSDQKASGSPAAFISYASQDAAVA